MTRLNMAARFDLLVKTLRCALTNIRFCSSYNLINRVLSGGCTSNNITVKGWVTSTRKMKDVVFIDINDGSSCKSLQVLVPKEKRPASLTNGSSIEVTGNITLNPRGQLEMAATSLNVIGECNTADKDFPFPPKHKHSHDYSRQHPHMKTYLPHFRSLLRVRHNATVAINNYLFENGFIHIHTPILTSNDCEGGGEVFKVIPLSEKLINEMKKKNQNNDCAFFGNLAFLSVSGQLHLEAVSRGLSKVYAFSPTFRAENSKSRLHLSEFYMIETEEAFIQDLNSLLDTMEMFVKNIINSMLTCCSEDLIAITTFDGLDPKQHEEFLRNIVDTPFIRMTYKEACDIISNVKTSKCVTEGLTKEEELFIVKQVGNVPVFVADWPESMKPFYMKGKDSGLVSAVDLLVPTVGELCGGSLREDNVKILTEKLRSCNLEKELQWYLDLRRFGNVPTGGFGMGFERFLQLVTGLNNIKDTIPFPRWPHSLKM